MATKYSYSITGAFPNQKVNPDSLTQQIEASSITVPLDYIATDLAADVCDIWFDSPLSAPEQTTLNGVVAAHQGDPPVYPETGFEYWQQDPDVTDYLTGKTAKFSIMQALINRREIFNDPDSPVYEAGHVPLIGAAGSVTNLNNIHDKLGWHQQQVLQSLYYRPTDLLIFYGWPNSFNSAVNAWNNEKVAQDMSRYGLIVLGDGLQTLLTQGTHTGADGASVLTDNTKNWTVDEFVGKKIVNVTAGSSGDVTGNTATTITGTLSGGTDNDWDTGDEYRVANHADYPNVVKIVDRIKQLHPATKIFGYVSVNQILSAFEAKADDWNTLGVHGIFMDEAGYDYGTVATNGRDAFNAKVDYVHALSSASTCFVNAWNMDHIIGTANDPSYPNTTWNPSNNESSLTKDDWYLLESYPINDAAYTASTPDGYEPKADWASRGVKTQGHRATYGINLAAVGIIANGNAGGQDLFDFLFVSACMWALDAVGSSDTSYGASSSAVDFWGRLDVSKMGPIYSLNASVQVDLGDADVYWRYVEFGTFELDFSDSAQDATVTKT
jgi:hypothetical protein